MAGSRATRSPRAGLSRQAIVDRALELGDAEGLDAVTLRRLASEFAVTPMALYRHVRDKQDLVNAMTEVVLDDLDLTTGIDAAWSWTDKIRRALQNYKEQIEARPIAMALSIEYTGDGPVSFWRMLDDLLGILVEAGFEQRQAVVLIRTLSNLLAGYLILVRSDANRPGVPSDPREIELLRKRFELAQLSLPGEGFPNLVTAAGDVADVWLSHPDRWWTDTVDLLVFGLEGLLERRSGAAHPA